MGWGKHVEWFQRRYINGKPFQNRAMTLYLIGLGLGDDRDLTLRGLETAKMCTKIYLECYTSLHPESDKEKLEQRIGKNILLADRTTVEQQTEKLLDAAKSGNAALLVVGDPLFATTHTDLLMRARSLGIAVQVIHNASVFAAVAQTGLQPYKFGKITSIPFPEKNFHPTGFFEVLKQNLSIEAHTLFLLDLRPSEKRFLTIAQAIELLLEIVHEKKDAAISGKTMAIGCARLGSANQKIVYATLDELQKMEFGTAPYCLIIPAKLHFAE